MNKVYQTFETKELKLGKTGGTYEATLEYSKIKDTRYGILVKEIQEYENSTSTEIKEIPNITEDESRIDTILEVLLDRKIVPYIAEEIVSDMMAIR